MGTSRDWKIPYSEMIYCDDCGTTVDMVATFRLCRTCIAKRRLDKKMRIWKAEIAVGAGFSTRHVGTRYLEAKTEEEAKAFAKAAFMDMEEVAQSPGILEMIYVSELGILKYPL